MDADEKRQKKKDELEALSEISAKYNNNKDDIYETSESRHDLQIMRAQKKANQALATITDDDQIELAYAAKFADSFDLAVDNDQIENAVNQIKNIGGINKAADMSTPVDDENQSESETEGKKIKSTPGFIRKYAKKQKKLLKK